VFKYIEGAVNAMKLVRLRFTVVWVTAVLERTVVIEPAPGEPKVLVNRNRLMVDPGTLRVRHLASKEAARRGREAARALRVQEQSSAA